MTLKIFPWLRKPLLVQMWRQISKTFSLEKKERSKGLKSTRRGIVTEDCNQVRNFFEEVEKCFFQVQSNEEEVDLELIQTVQGLQHIEMRLYERLSFGRDLGLVEPNTEQEHLAKKKN